MSQIDLWKIEDEFFAKLLFIKPIEQTDKYYEEKGFPEEREYERAGRAKTRS